MIDKDITKVTSSASVTFQVSTCEKRGLMTITASGCWPNSDGGFDSAEACRVIDIEHASKFSKAVSVEQFVEATKRDALRELVTQLNIHGVL